ncbi:MAG: DUF6056 family protein [Chloroflexi bacterium]|nr:DUF6056 family protein [Chloroflexota bacterium]
MASRSTLARMCLPLALVPLLLFAYSGQFSRMIADDYCRIESGSTRDPFTNVMYWRSRHTGSYTNYFLHAVFAPLDWQITRIIPAVTSFIWLVGLSWLLYRAFGFWGWRRHGLIAAVTCASLLLAATVGTFYTPQIYYHYTVQLSYTAPIVLLTLYMAAVLDSAIRLRSVRSQAVAAVASLVFCFLNAGFSEMYLVTQLALLPVFLGASYLFVARPHRRLAFLLLFAGLLGTVAGGVAQLAAPGVSMRAAASHQLVKPVQALPDLIEMTTRQAVEYLIDADVFAGFALAFALAMAAALMARAPGCADSGLKQSGKTLSHLGMGLGLQLAFIPFLWAHASDAPQFFERFSLPYMVVISLNFALIICYVAWLFRRSKSAAPLIENQRWAARVAGLVLAAAFTLFMATQFKSIHARAELFLYLSALALLAHASIWLPPALPPSVTRRSWGLVLTCLSAAIFCALVLSLVALYGVGFVSARYFGPVAVLQLFAGFVWGLLVGAALGCHLRASGARSETVWAFKLAPLLVALVIGIDIVGAQLRWLPDLQTFAKEWDARHQYIMEQRDSGQSEIIVWPLRYNMASEFRNVSSPHSRSYENYCSSKYYGVDSVEVRDP